ncbi:hypothetical protein PRUPE_1G223000 [Prunus persica]|uniref:Uncharacterized protein n=1 Tax=Prunus persica TaxID=3760 RepID=M5XJE7_PRUPE|nr:hypothetical protein PRUPE_1G223000 [Prunus persica]
MNTWEGVEIGEEVILSDIINMYYKFFFFFSGRGGGDAKEFGIHLFVKTRHKCRIYQETLNVEPCNYFFSGIAHKYIWGMAVSAPQVLSKIS